MNLLLFTTIANYKSGFTKKKINLKKEA